MPEGYVSLDSNGTSEAINHKKLLIIIESFSSKINALSYKSAHHKHSDLASFNCRNFTQCTTLWKLTLPSHWQTPQRPDSIM